MPRSAVQEIVDILAEHLRRSVVVDDAEVRLLYASRHFGDEDEARVRAVLQRVADGKVIGHVLAQGVARWSGPGVLPAQPGLGFKARFCVPIRWRGRLRGLLIVLDADGSLTAAETAELEAAARRLAPLLVEADGDGVDPAGRNREALVAALLDPDAAIRRDAVQALGGAGFSGPCVQAMTVEVRDPGKAADLAHAAMRNAGKATDPAPDAGKAADPARDAGKTADPAHVEIALRHALGARVPGAPGGTLSTVRERGATLIFGTRSALPGPWLDKYADQLRQHVTELSDGRFGCVVGIGPTVTGLDAAWLSQRQAALACRAASGLLPAPVVRWSELGVFGILLRLPAAEVSRQSLPDELQRLLAVDRDGHLVATLRAYLDAGGSGPGAAAALHIHRTTLYYRLGRITELAGLDLADPATRLALHLGVRLLEMIEGDLRH